MATLWNHKLFRSTILVCSAFLYLYFGYGIVRADVVIMIGIWTALFACFFVLIQYTTDTTLLAKTALVFRILFLLAIPNLSQDFYRFIWDGRMLLEGFNPYLSLPQTWISQGNVPIAQAQELYEGMGTLNGSHYTNYPPISQLCYAITAVCAEKSILGAVMVFRLLIVASDIGIFFFGKKLLKALQLPEKNIFWYLLNPFVIIELTGNLHFEAVMIFFIIWSLYLLQKGKWYWAAIILGCSVTVKLIPLLFLPLYYQKLQFDKTKQKEVWITMKGILRSAQFYGMVLVTIVILFAPFLSVSFISNFSTTIGLWFQKFEFNASIYYLIRWVGYQTVGWNIIGTVGKILPVCVIIIILALSFFRKNRTMIELITVMVISISSYYFLSTTVHPWYIAVPLSLCVFTRYKFPIVWSFVIILSYTAYVHLDFKENLWMVALEYGIVFTIFVKEVIVNTKTIALKPIESAH